MGFRGDRNGKCYNGEGYEDMTAYHAICNEEARSEAKEIIIEMLKAVKGSRFEVTERIVLRDKRTGRIYK